MSNDSADVFLQVWIGEQRSLGQGLPSAYSSVFGWVLIGPVLQDVSSNAHCMLATVNPSIESLMERFWDVEEPEEAPLQFTDEGCCEARFKAETIIDERGHHCATDIYSDCGTNFVGASRQLRQFFLDSTVRFQVSSHLPCSWHFNPPSAPHFGGLWEAAVKSMKKLLVGTVGAHTLTFEELATVVCRIESVLNSRPLTPLSSEPGDLESLTPGHFLTGQPLLCVPEPDVSVAPSRLVSRWKLLHQCHQAFWKRWSLEYLNNLQIRSKWTASDTPLKVGDLVCIKDDLSTPLCWRLGRVTELLSGQNRVVRVVKLLTGQGTLVRPVVKLVRLPTK
ncbi:uncharacterized protein LOC111035558 [Myzus persicae]|uniref:uncharacterized protein LOC111035558 n=1 Tax=Myzus persicae TaxID=13164 RepID=UPI000B9370B2|nr:uncharacterized protein LOC111035558 [Myzus persicae]